jgi:AraC-like DNA-binding protein
VAAQGQDRAFKVLSVPQHLFASTAAQVRPAGYQLVPAHAPLSGLLSSYLAHLCQDFARLDGPSVIASLKALDLLLATALGAKDPPSEDPAPTMATERCRAALRYIEANLETPALSPASIAGNFGISQRQLHRTFEPCGKTVSSEIRRLRVEHAKRLMRIYPAMRITDVALRRR